MTAQSFPWLIVTGALTGLIGSLLGVGGGVFLVPVLVLLFHVPMHLAVGTSLVVVVTTSSTVGALRGAAGTPNLPLGLVLELSTLVGAIGGGLVAGLVPARALVAIFGLILLPIGVLMWKRNRPAAAATPATSGYQVRNLPAGLSVSFLAGAISGLLGVGGGIMKIPALTLLCGVPTKVAVATSNFMIGITAAASVFLYIGRREVEPMLTAAVVVGVMIGSGFGLALGRKLEGWQIRRVFAALLWITATQMLLRAGGWWLR